jgi:RNA polymerase I-specific transcription initiation factor RRN7
LNRSGYGSGTGTFMFSSTSEGENDTDGTRGGKSLASSRSRRSAANGEERLPKLVETMGLCYLGMVLMRLNTSLGEVYKWATRDEIVFNRAASCIDEVHPIQKDTC